MRKKNSCNRWPQAQKQHVLYIWCATPGVTSSQPRHDTHAHSHALCFLPLSQHDKCSSICWLRPQLLKMNRVNITSSICIRVGKTFFVTRVVECVQTCVCVCVRESDGSRAAAGDRSPETFISHYRRDGWRGWRRGREGGEEETWRTDQKDREEGRQRGKQRRRENSRGCLEVRKRRPHRRVRRLSLPRGCEQMLAVTLDVGFIRMRQR